MDVGRRWWWNVDVCRRWRRSVDVCRGPWGRRVVEGRRTVVQSERVAVTAFARRVLVRGIALVRACGWSRRRSRRGLAVPVSESFLYTVAIFLARVVCIASLAYPR